ncbi:MAG: transposase [bacterium]|nr:transposase [bacterium]
MRCYHLRNWILKQINVKLRLQLLCFWYHVSLMVDARKHSLHFAASVSGLTPSQFSKFLRNHLGIAACTLDELSKRHAKRFGPILKELEDLPWKIALVIDATLQTRAGLHTENSKRFNHGHGVVIGHQWTNIVLILNGVLIPLPPIPFYSKNYCNPLKITYNTEHDRLVDYLTALNLESYLGPHRSEDVIVLTDSGYDVKKIQNTIRTKHWHFLGALKGDRSVKSPAQNAKTTKSRGWTGIAQFFKDHRRLRWQTICGPTKSPKQKRMEFRVRQVAICDRFGTGRGTLRESRQRGVWCLNFLRFERSERGVSREMRGIFDGNMCTFT